MKFKFPVVIIDEDFRSGNASGLGIRALAEAIEREGIEYWDRVTIEDLQKQSILASDFSCQSCSAPVSSFKKEQDILDVWFDSGISHYAVLTEKFGLTFPADLYL